MDGNRKQFRKLSGSPVSNRSRANVGTRLHWERMTMHENHLLLADEGKKCRTKMFVAQMGQWISGMRFRLGSDLGRKENGPMGPCKETALGSAISRTSAQNESIGLEWD